MIVEKGADKIEIFHELTPPQLDELYSWLERREYLAGAEIIREGRLPGGMYVLTGGNVAVVKSSKVRNVKLTEIKAPSFFGEIGLLNNQARSAGIRAVSNVIVGYLPTKLFSNKLAENNLTALRISLNIGRTVCKRLCATTELLANTVILTGALQPTRMRDSDAEFNLGGAIIATQTCPAGVYIVMHGRIFPWDRCRKNPQSGQFEPL